MSYSLTKKILVSYQYYFRSGYTATDRLEDLIDAITKAIDEENFAVSIFDCILRGNNYEWPSLQLVKLPNKIVRIINNMPLRDHIT